jgi:hypothetical protein
MRDTVQQAATVGVAAADRIDDTARVGDRYMQHSAVSVDIEPCAPCVTTSAFTRRANSCNDSRVRSTTTRAS